MKSFNFWGNGQPSIPAMPVPYNQQLAEAMMNNPAPTPAITPAAYNQPTKAGFLDGLMQGMQPYNTMANPTGGQVPNPLGLSQGSGFTPQDIAKIRADYGN